MKPSTVTALLRTLEAIETCTRLSGAQQLARDAISMIGAGAPAVKTARMDAQAFYDALSTVQSRACADVARWDLQPDAVAGWAAWPTARSFKWRNRHGDIAIIKCPAQIKVPAARYWDGGVIPPDLTVHPMYATRRSYIPSFRHKGVSATDAHLAAASKDDLAADAAECRRLAQEWTVGSAEAAWFATQAQRLGSAAQSKPL